MRAHLRLAWVVVLAVATGAGLARAGAAEELSGVRVCADPANLPFSSSDAVTPGFEVELARALAPHVSFHWVPTYRWIYVRRQLLDRRCDLFFGLPVDPRFTDDNPRLALSRPYYVMGQVIVSRAGEGVRGLEDLRGKAIGVQAMTPGDILVWQRGHARRVYLAPEEPVRAVLAGEVAAAVMWSSVAGWLTRRTPGLEIAWIREPEGEFPVAVGMRKEDRALAAALDRALGRLLGEGRAEAILRRYGVPVSP